MGFVKVVKNKAYYKRFQVKFRRRREAKTDYYARKRLVIQDKDKYNTPKYRFVVRITNRDVIAQLAFATIKGDRIIASAYSHELKNYGISVGLKNYSAAYAVGLLLARRHLTKLGLNTLWAPNTDIGAEFHPGKTSVEGGARRPFKALLDVGLRRTTTGSRIFAAVKGASDGGLNVPHSNKRFVGTAKGKVNPEVLRNYIVGGHVANWMRILQKRDNGTFEKRFSQYIKAGVSADALEKTWLSVHERIRNEPFQAKAAKKTYPEGSKPKSYATPRSTLAERKARIAAAVAARDAKSDE